MTITVIESTNKAALDLYQNSAAFKADFPDPNAKTSAGETEDSDLDGQGPIGPLYWLLIEDENLEDNATFRLDSNGRPTFWATGVEV